MAINVALDAPAPRWRREDLAEKTNISVVSIKHFEDEHHQTRTTTIAKITKVMEDAGIEFLPNSGLRLRDDTLTVIEGADALLRLMDDIYYTLKDGAQMGKDGEVLWGFIDETASPPEILAADKKSVRPTSKCAFWWRPVPAFSPIRWPNIAVSLTNCSMSTPSPFMGIR
jgi:hypothetical protein